MEIIDQLKAEHQKAYEYFLKNGENWMMDRVSNPRSVSEALANLIYYDFLEKIPEGKKQWAKGGQTERKVDRIIEAIEDHYLGEIVSDEEWNRECEVKLNQESFAYDVTGMTAKISVASEIGEMVWNGVF